MASGSFFQGAPTTYTEVAGATPNQSAPDTSGNAKSSFFEASGLPYAAVPAVAGVNTFNGRYGTVTAQLGDYTFSQLAGIPTTLAGYGITDALKNSNNLADVSSVVTSVKNLGLRVRLLANTTYNVTTAGNDTTGDGSVGAPWLTLQKAVNFIQSSVDLNGFAVTVNVGAGTYAGFSLSGQWVGHLPSSLNGTTVTFNGDTTTPANVSITSGVTVTECASLSMQGFQFAPTSAIALSISRSALFNLSGNCTFAGTSVVSHIAVSTGALCILSAGYTIASSASTAHFQLLNNSVLITPGGITITLTGTPAIANFMLASKCATTNTGGITFVGSATGTRYTLTTGAIVDTSGGGANYFPGNVAGSNITGSQYI